MRPGLTNVGIFDLPRERFLRKKKSIYIHLYPINFGLSNKDNNILYITAMFFDHVARDAAAPTALCIKPESYFLPARQRLVAPSRGGRGGGRGLDVAANFF